PANAALISTSTLFIAITPQEQKRRYLVLCQRDKKMGFTGQLRFEGYSISYRDGHASVRIQMEEYLRLKAYFMDLARRRTAKAMTSEFWNVPFESYAPVREQMRCILRAVNRERKTAGFDPVPLEAVRYKRRVYWPFKPLHEQRWFTGETRLRREAPG
ncbi:MAG: hypothetical protein V3W41_20330, partial [Planctomycetota bacterium]